MVLVVMASMAILVRMQISIIVGELPGTKNRIGTVVML